MLTILAVIAAAIWIVGACIIMWAYMSTADNLKRDLPIALTMAVFWPMWVILGIVSALYEIHRTNKSNQPTKPIDRQNH